MNTKIKTGIGLIIILILVTTIGVFVWHGKKGINLPFQPKKERACMMEAKICPDGTVAKVGPNCEFAPCPDDSNVQLANPASVYCQENGGTLEIRDEEGGQVGYCKFTDGSECEEWAYYRGDCRQIGKKVTNQDIDYSKIEFDDCGKKEKYQNLFWWDDFKYRVEQTNFYSDNYVYTQMNSGPKKYDDDYNSYCKETRGMDICVDGRNKKILIDDTYGNEFEGCLSKDGRIFVSVMKGVYLGGGNNIFRYDIKNNILEVAVRINEEWGRVWYTVPREFLKRDGNVIKMIGAEGDAGWGEENTFDYNFVENTVKLVKSCNISEGVEPDDCVSY